MPGQLIRETNPAQGFAPALVPQHEDVNGDYKSTGEKNPLPVSVEDSGAAAQTDLQYRKQTTKVTHANVNVPINSYSLLADWIDTDGFDKVYIMSTIDAAVTNSFDVHWSHDKTTMHHNDSAISGSTNSLSKHVLLDTKARWMKVHLRNSDTVAPHVMSGFVYLKV
jgi:hypothetical protein